MSSVGLNQLPYSFPLHPSLVHFTIGLFITAILADLFGVLYRPKSVQDQAQVERLNFFDIGWWNLLMATMFTVATVAVGIYEIVLAKPPENLTTAWGLSGELTMHLHGISGIILFGIMIALTVWRGLQRYRWRRTKSQQVSRKYVMVGVLVVGLMSIQGILGSHLAHDIGIHNTAAIGRSSVTQSALAPVQLQPNISDPLAPHPPSLAKSRTISDSMVYPPLNLPDPKFAQVEQTLYYGVSPILRLPDSTDWIALLERLNQRSWRADQFKLDRSGESALITLAGQPLLHADRSLATAWLHKLQQAFL
jgi:uncharacterized membrane protein